MVVLYANTLQRLHSRFSLLHCRRSNGVGVVQLLDWVGMESTHNITFLRR